MRFGSPRICAAGGTIGTGYARDQVRLICNGDEGEPPLPRAGRVGVGVLPQIALIERRIDFPHPPRTGAQLRS
jgi:hypothetical protein